jgi:hypothetical protein
MARILTGDIVAFPAGPGLLTLPNDAVVTCPGKYTVPAKGKYRFTPYAAGVGPESFTVYVRPRDKAAVTRHEIGEAPALVDDVDEDDQEGTGE